MSPSRRRHTGWRPTPSPHSRWWTAPYAHLANTLARPEIALSVLTGLEERLKSEGTEVKRAPFGWYKEFTIHSKGHPLADLSMTICPYGGIECDFQCPYCHNPLREADLTPGPGNGKENRK